MKGLAALSTFAGAGICAARRVSLAGLEDLTKEMEQQDVVYEEDKFQPRGIEEFRRWLRSVWGRVLSSQWRRLCKVSTGPAWLLKPDRRPSFSCIDAKHPYYSYIT